MYFEHNYKENKQQKENPMDFKLSTWLINIGIGLLVILFLAGTCTIVKPGERGVLITLGKASHTVRTEGVNLRFPIIQKIVKMSIRVHTVECEKMFAASASMQDVFVDVVLNYHIEPDSVVSYYRKFGKDNEFAVNTVIYPKLQEDLKAITNKHSSENLLKMRQAIRDSIFNSISKTASKHGIVIDEFSMTNFRFSDSYQNAIEAKQVMEQNVEKTLREKELVKQQSEIKILQAQAEANANRLKQTTITPTLIEYEKVMKWDGKLPQVTGNAVPMINLGK